MWPNSQFAADLVLFKEEILNEKPDLLCSVNFEKPTDWFLCNEEHWH